MSGQATRTERISLNKSLAALRRDPAPALRGRRHGTLRSARWRLGIADLFERAGRNPQGCHLTGLTQLDYNLDFIINSNIKSNAGLEPCFLVVPIGNDRSVGGGFKLTGSNSDTQKAQAQLSCPWPRDPRRAGWRPAPGAPDLRPTRIAWNAARAETCR